MHGHSPFVLAMLLVLAAVAVSGWGAAPSNGRGQSRSASAVADHSDGTPIAQVADPLDGAIQDAQAIPDPLDDASSDLDQPDANAPDDFDALSIVRSGRSRSAPDSSVAYDSDRSTSWSAGGLDDSWVWFDFGEPARIRELRWLTTGLGSLTVEVSDDRKNWREVAASRLSDTWSGVKLREDARYVRISFSVQGSDEASLVEFAAYGQSVGQGAGGGRSVDLPQKSKQGASDRKERRDRAERRPQRASTVDQAESNGPDEDTGESGVAISAKPGKTKCKGDKAKCRADEGKTRVEEDCATEGTCVIDVRVDGGTAMCDSSGGEKNETGQGEGKQPGRGGRCEAVADGGTVTIGDINP